MDRGEKRFEKFLEYRREERKIRIIVRFLVNSGERDSWDIIESREEKYLNSASFLTVSFESWDWFRVIFDLSFVTLAKFCEISNTHILQ